GRSSTTARQVEAGDQARKDTRVAPQSRSTRNSNPGGVGAGSREPRSSTASAPGASQPPSPSRVSAGSPSPAPYGGSRNAMSNGAPSPAGLTPSAVASRRWTRVAPKRPRASMLARIAPLALSSVSTNRQNAAPRDSASRPSAPAP